MEENRRIKLPFALNESDEMVHISDVARGTKCNCVCPGCGFQLVAAKGTKNQHHFKHATGGECKWGVESAIHLAAKQIIREKKQITLSEYVCIASQQDSRGYRHTESKAVLQDVQSIIFDTVDEEVEVCRMRADLLATKMGQPLVIEIFYRHKVEDDKIQKIADADISAIEINLTDLKTKDLENWDNFWKAINDTRRVRWLHNAKAGAVKSEIEKLLAEKIHSKEEGYKAEKLQKEKNERSARGELPQVLEELKSLSSQDSILRIKNEAKAHPFWKEKAQYLPFNFDDLPDFVNEDVQNSDWIYGCDRRVWQTAFYNSFVCYKPGRGFSIEGVDRWLQDKIGCRVPSCLKTLRFCRKHCRQLIPVDIASDFPSPWKTLKSYFWYLCDLGILEFTGEDYSSPGNEWFRAVRKTPTKTHSRIYPAVR